MRWLAIALTAVLVGCSSGAVKGKVILGVTPAKLGIYAAIWSVDAQLSNPDDPHSILIPRPGGASPTFMGTVAVGTTSGKAGSYDFAFHTLDRGLYFLGAYLADPGDPSPDIEGAIHTIDQISLLEVDPDNKKKQEISHDIYLGISGPGTGTIRGTVRASSRAANSTISVWAGDGSLLDASTSLFMRQKLPTGTDVPFSLFNVPLGSTTLFADSDVGNDGSLSNDFVGFPSPNPIVLDGGHTEQNDVDIWVDRQAPTLGSISGTLLLNAPVANAQVELLVEAKDGAVADGTHKLVGLFNLVVNGQSADFTIPSQPFGSLYISSSIAVVVNGTTLSASNYYPGPPNLPGPVYLSSAQPNVSEVRMPIGVGQILGKIDLKNIPATDKAVWVVTSIDQPNPNPDPNSKPPQLPLYGTGFALDGSASFSTDYGLFGFTDNNFHVFLVPTTSLDDDPISVVNAGGLVIDGSPETVTVEGGNRVNSQFTYDFAAP